MSKHDVALAKILASNNQFTSVVGALRHIISVAAVVACIYLIVEGFKPVISRDADSIRAFAQVIRAVRLDTIVAGLGAAFFGVAWRLERSGKKRALAKKASYQKQLEAGDDYRSSSENPI